jgi:small subunit ribosomal protein S16
MVKIRLSRQGVKDKLFYRIVVVDKKKKRGGQALDIIGYWNPIKDEKKLDKEKIRFWKEKGALVTKAVEKLL